MIRVDAMPTDPPMIVGASYIGSKFLENGYIALYIKGLDRFEVTLKTATVIT